MWLGGAPTVAAWLLFLALALQHTADAEDQWQVKCMPPCTCGLSHFADLPVATQWLQHETPPPKEAPSNNQVTYDDDQQELGELLKMAMCVFQRGTDPQLVLGLLPKDIQVLTILQGRDSGKIALEADYFQEFQHLMVLDIQGFQPDEDSSEDRLVLRNDALRPLFSLQYLNLQNIKLLGHVGPDNRLHPMERATRKRRVVLLKPTENDIPLVSYQEYKQEMERAGLTTFAGLSDLLLLRVYACDLREVNWEMFQGLGKLQYLSLERNNLLFVPEFAFYGTPHLKSLSLAGNQLLSLEDTALAGLLELDRLDLSSNNFSHLSELSLPPFPELRTADFRYNPVEAVFPSTFEIMNATFVLYLGGKKSLLNLLPNSFLGLSSLKKLDILNIGVPLLERELLRGMPQLQTLVMTGSIHSITFDAFLEVPKLEYLILNNCNITSVSMDAFYGLYGLISLDLSYNLLTWLPPGVFDQQFSLKELILSNNKLTEIPTSVFSRVPAKMIRLENNPWHCSCAMREWQASAINKVKQKGTIEGSCTFAEDKGTGCQRSKVERYIYDKRVSPKCATPIKYNNWNVFHLLRKELHCNSKHKKDKKLYLKKKYEDYEKSIKPEHTMNKYRTLEKALERNVGNKEYALPTVTVKAISLTLLMNSTQPQQIHTDAIHSETKTNKGEEVSPVNVQSGKAITPNNSGMLTGESNNSKTLALAASNIELQPELDQKTVNNDSKTMTLPTSNTETQSPRNEKAGNNTDSKTMTLPASHTETQSPRSEKAGNNTDSKTMTLPASHTETQSPRNEKAGNNTDSKTMALPASHIEAPLAKDVKAINKGSTTLAPSNVEAKLTPDESAVTGRESDTNKKNKQQLIMQQEKEAKSILKEKIKSGIIAIDQSERPEKELKKALKLDMEKKRNEKLKRIQLETTEQKNL